MVDPEDHIKLIDFGIAGKEGSRRLTFAKLSQVMGTPITSRPAGAGQARRWTQRYLLPRRDALRDAHRPDPVLRAQSVRRDETTACLNHPTPPRELEPRHPARVTGSRLPAMERDPRKRYSTANEFAWDLEHLDQVGVTDRAEMARVEAAVVKSPGSRRSSST